MRTSVRMPASPAYLVPCLLKRRNEWYLTLLQPTAPHHPPEIGLRGPAAHVPAMRIIDSQHIFRRARLHHQNDIGILSTIHHCEFAPLLDGILDATNGGTVIGQQVGIELIAVVGRYVYKAGVSKSTRQVRSSPRFGGTTQHGQRKTQQHCCKDVLLHDDYLY